MPQYDIAKSRHLAHQTLQVIANNGLIPCTEYENDAMIKQTIED